jgi:hypothetical protein
MNSLFQLSPRVVQLTQYSILRLNAQSISASATLFSQNCLASVKDATGSTTAPAAVAAAAVEATDMAGAPAAAGSAPAAAAADAPVTGGDG